jgi:hypothetical protein
MLWWNRSSRCAQRLTKCILAVQSQKLVSADDTISFSRSTGKCGANQLTCRYIRFAGYDCLSLLVIYKIGSQTQNIEELTTYHAGYGN